MPGKTKLDYGTYDSQKWNEIEQFADKLNEPDKKDKKGGQHYLAIQKYKDGPICELRVLSSNWVKRQWQRFVCWVRAPDKAIIHFGQVPGMASHKDYSLELTKYSKVVDALTATFIDRALASSRLTLPGKKRRWEIMEKAGIKTDDDLKKLKSCIEVIGDKITRLFNKVHSSSNIPENIHSELSLDVYKEKLLKEEMESLDQARQLDVLFSKDKEIENAPLHNQAVLRAEALKEIIVTFCLQTDTLRRTMPDLFKSKAQDLSLILQTAAQDIKKASAEKLAEKLAENPINIIKQECEKVDELCSSFEGIYNRYKNMGTLTYLIQYQTNRDFDPFFEFRNALEELRKAYIKKIADEAKQIEKSSLLSIDRLNKRLTHFQELLKQNIAGKEVAKNEIRSSLATFVEAVEDMAATSALKGAFGVGDIGDEVPRSTLGSAKAVLDHAVHALMSLFAERASEKLSESQEEILKASKTTLVSLPTRLHRCIHFLEKALGLKESDTNLIDDDETIPLHTANKFIGLLDALKNKLSQLLAGNESFKGLNNSELQQLQLKIEELREHRGVIEGRRHEFTTDLEGPIWEKGLSLEKAKILQEKLLNWSSLYADQTNQKPSTARFESWLKNPTDSQNNLLAQIKKELEQEGVNFNLKNEVSPQELGKAILQVEERVSALEIYNLQFEQMKQLLSPYRDKLVSIGFYNHDYLNWSPDEWLIPERQLSKKDLEPFLVLKKQITESSTNKTQERWLLFNRYSLLHTALNDQIEQQEKLKKETSQRVVEQYSSELAGFIQRIEEIQHGWQSKMNDSDKCDSLVHDTQSWCERTLRSIELERLELAAIREKIKVISTQTTVTETEHLFHSLQVSQETSQKAERAAKAALKIPDQAEAVEIPNTLQALFRG